MATSQFTGLTPARGSVTVECAHCHVQFKVSASRMRDRNIAFCSQECRVAARTTIRTCLTCGKEFRPRPIHVTKGFGHYCSKACAYSKPVNLKEKILRDHVTDPSTGCWTSKEAPQKYKTFTVHGQHFAAHRLSAHYFLGMPLDSPLFVCHRCDNPQCFNPDHLFVGTPADNSHDMVAKRRNQKGDDHFFRRHPELMPRGDDHFSRRHPELMSRGEAHGSSKLTESDVQKIRSLLSSGVRQRTIAAKFNVSQHAIWSINTGATWKHVR